MIYFKVKLRHLNEPWEETGRTFLLPKSEFVSIRGAREEFDGIRKVNGRKGDWSIESIEEVNVTLDRE